MNFSDEPIPFAPPSLLHQAEVEELNSFLLVSIDNWKELDPDATPLRRDAIHSHIYQLVYEHFELDVRSFTISEGEFFVMLSRARSTTLIRACNTLKHALNNLDMGFGVPLEVSMALTQAGDNWVPYKVLLRLRRALNASREQGSNLLCIT
ncbi:MAG: hypothetical protein AAFR61_12640 [Bacteroidota bacterium]